MVWGWSNMLGGGWNTPPPWGSTKAGGEIGSIKEDPGAACAWPSKVEGSRKAGGLSSAWGICAGMSMVGKGGGFADAAAGGGTGVLSIGRGAGISKEEPWERVAVDFKGVGSGMKDPKAVGLRGGGAAWARAASACGVSVFFAGGGAAAAGEVVSAGGSSSKTKSASG